MLIYGFIPVVTQFSGLGLGLKIINLTFNGYGFE